MPRRIVNQSASMMSVDEYARAFAAAYGPAATILASTDKRKVAISIAVLKAVDDDGAATRADILSSVRSRVPDATDAEIYEGAKLVAEISQVLPAKRLEVIQ